MNAQKQRPQKTGKKSFATVAKSTIQELRQRRVATVPGPERRVLTVQIRALRKQMRAQVQAKKQSQKSK